MFRVGFGQDSHKLINNLEKRLVLGGVELKSKKSFEGNSDGDVVIHALCNALEQAIGGDSLAVYTDPMCKKGITDSKEYLKVAMKHVKEKGYSVNNVGISIEAKFPMILPIAHSMRGKLSLILEVNKEDIGINATSGEGMTPFGKGKGIQAFVVVSLMKK